MTPRYRPCIIIPFYNHGSTLSEVIERLLPYQYPIIVVNDGSSEDDTTIARKLAKAHETVHLLEHHINSGKGSALQLGMREAYAMGYTHALQIDADLQHDIDDVPLLLKEAEEAADCIILAYPVFGNEAPWERVWGRKLTTAMIALHTFSCSVKDGLFGFRVYPLKETVHVLDKHTMAARMAFDTEILVRLIHQGVGVRNIPSKVQYHKDGISHFRYIADNVGMIFMHIRLLYSTALFSIKKFIHPKKSYSWYQKKELGYPIFLVLLYRIGKLCGTSLLKVILIPILWSITLFHGDVRRNSSNYLRRVLESRKTPGIIHTYRHLRTFAHTLIDGVFEWDAAKNKRDRDVHLITSLRKHLYKGNGGLILGAHIGSLEYARARFSADDRLKIKPLMYHANSQMYQSFLKKVNPDAHHDVVLIESMSPATIIHLREFVESGGYLALLADRPAPGTQDRTVQCTLFGELVELPFGPFLLAELLKADVVTFFPMVTPGQDLTFHWKDITPSWDRRNKEKVRQSLIEAYARELESICKQYPYHWFNFYDYFHDLETTKKEFQTSLESSGVL